MKLISLLEFVLNEKKWKGSYEREKAFERIISYAEFLKQPLTLGMFVPCDKNGNILTELKTTVYQDANFDIDEMEIWNKAKEGVLFKDFSIRLEKGKSYVGVEGYEIELSILPKLKMTIEDLSNDWWEIELTESAIKQIGL